MLSSSSSASASISTRSLLAAGGGAQCSAPQRGLLVVAAAAAEGRKRITKSVAAAAAAAAETEAAAAAAAAAAPATTVRKRRAATTTKAKKESAATEAPSTPPTSSLPPPPAPYPAVDLRACLPPDPAPFAAVQRWVLFSDLHVCDRTVDASVAALAAVREEARRDPAARTGVAFLGDFWHARGSLPVRPLNAVLDEMARWKDIPLLMLVGNHDQVTAGGEEHALEAVAAAAAAAGSPAHVFDRPALFLGALWLPYRRDPAELSAAIAEAARAGAGAGVGAGAGAGAGASQEGNHCGPPSVVFAHTDVIGAAANDAYQSGKGLEPGAFPARAWLGHYHKPHVVGGGAEDEVEGVKKGRRKTTKNKNKPSKAVVEYIGSPYQVSRAEAGQQKALVVLRGLSDSNSLSPDSRHTEPRHDWSEIARVPLDVGPRHFDLRGLEPEAPEGLRPGDR